MSDKFNDNYHWSAIKDLPEQLRGTISNVYDGETYSDPSPDRKVLVHNSGRLATTDEGKAYVHNEQTPDRYKLQYRGSNDPYYNYRGRTTLGALFGPERVNTVASLWNPGNEKKLEFYNNLMGAQSAVGGVVLSPMIANGSASLFGKVGGTVADAIANGIALEKPIDWGIKGVTAAMLGLAPQAAKANSQQDTKISQYLNSKGINYQQMLQNPDLRAQWIREHPQDVWGLVQQSGVYPDAQIDQNNGNILTKAPSKNGYPGGLGMLTIGLERFGPKILKAGSNNKWLKGARIAGEIGAGLFDAYHFGKYMDWWGGDDNDQTKRFVDAVINDYNNNRSNGITNSQSGGYMQNAQSAENILSDELGLAPVPATKIDTDSIGE